jgi:hypothetical protein
MVSIPMFYGNSYLHYMEPQILQHINNNKLDLRLRFRAFSPSGLLLWAGSINPDISRSHAVVKSHRSLAADGDRQTASGPMIEPSKGRSTNWISGQTKVINPASSYMWLALKDGQLEYQHQLDLQLLPLRLQLSNISRLDDGLWHELHLQRRRNEVLLQVDQFPHVRSQLSVEEQQLGSLVSNQGLYLGEFMLPCFCAFVFSRFDAYASHFDVLPQADWKTQHGEPVTSTAAESSAASLTFI